MSGVEGFILAGGASRRMGVPKADLHLGGMSLAERSTRTLGAVCDKIFIVGYGGAGNIEVLKDVHPPNVGNHRASLVGLYSALVNCRAPLAAVLACDLPFVSDELFGRLKEIALDDPNSAAVVPVQPDGRLQPLCAIYRAGVCLPTIRAALDSGDWRLQETVGRLKIQKVDFLEIAGLAGAKNFFFNVNTPADYETATRLIALAQDAQGPS
jgi:molybdopterin-guanine dinucleotide biosynthesis protein A